MNRIVTGEQWLAQFCKSTRAEAGLTQRKLAERLQVSHTYISKIENCNTEILPSIEFLTALAGVCNDPVWMVLANVGKIDCASLAERAGESMAIAELLGRIATGEVDDNAVHEMLLDFKHGKVQLPF